MTVAHVHTAMSMLTDHTAQENTVPLNDKSEFHDIQFLQSVQKNSRAEKSVPRSVSLICFSMSQQKLDVFHFLLWWLWKGGWARSKDVAMETLSFPVRSYLRMKQMLFVTY